MKQERKKENRRKISTILLVFFTIAVVCFFFVKWGISTFAAEEHKIKVNGEEITGEYEMTDSKIQLSVDGIETGQSVKWQIIEDSTIENVDISNNREDTTFSDSTYEVNATDCYVKAVKFGQAKVLVKVLDANSTPVFDSSITININFHISKVVGDSKNAFRKISKNAQTSSLILKSTDSLKVNVGKASDYTWRVSDSNVAETEVSNGNTAAVIKPVGAGKTTLTVEGNDVEDTLDIYVVPDVTEEGTTGSSKAITLQSGKGELKTNARFTPNSTELIYQKMDWAIYQLNKDGRSYTLLEDSLRTKESELIEFSSVSAADKDKLKVEAKAGQYVVKFWPKGIYTGNENSEELEYIDAFSDKISLDVRANYSNRDVTLCVGDKFDLSEAMNVDRATFLSGYDIKTYEGQDTTESSPNYISRTSEVVTAKKATNSTYVRIEVIPKLSADLPGGSDGTVATTVFQIRVIDSLLLNGSNVSLVVGGTMQLYVSTGNNSGELTWESSNEEYVTVDDTGLITGVKSTTNLRDGSVTVTVSLKLSDGSTRVASCKVVVEDTIQNITLSKSECSLLEGASETIRAVFEPDRNEAPLKWISSDESIFSLNVASDKKSAVVTANQAGTAILTVMNQEDFVTAVCKITVVSEMESLTLGQDAMTVRLSQQTVKMQASYEPVAASNNTLIWTSSDTSVATVDTEGVVTLVAAGATYITVRPTYDTTGGIRAQCLLTVQQSATGISLKNKSVSVEKGKISELQYSLSPTEDAVTTVNWKSMDESIATVDAQGNVTAKSVGGTYIIVTTSEGYSDIASIIVTQKATGIALTDSSITVATDLTKQIGYTLEPADATSAVSWHSLDETVATVDANGVVTGKKVGKTTVIATVEGILSYCEVTVVKAADSVQLDEKEISMQIGDQKTMHYTVTPSDAQTSLIWRSMDETVATVDVDGVVTAVSVGETYIIMTSAEGYMDTCKVTVTQKSTGVNLVDQEIRILKGNTKKIEYVVTPADATANVTWASLDEDIVTVDADGVVTAVSVGTTSVIMTNADNGATEICKIIVTDVSTNIELDLADITIVNGATKKITYKLVPEDASTTLTWSSLDENIASVDTEGNVTAKAVGYTYIVVTSVDGYSATCKVTVVQGATGIQLGNTSLTLGVGDVYQMPVTITPEDATDKTVSWYSKNPEIASVDTEGNITGVAVGETVIIASIANGEMAYLNVTVKRTLTGITLDKSNEELTVGQLLKISVTFNPSDASNQNVTWTSSDTAVATVGTDGTVTGVSGGIAMITCTSESGGYTATCIVNVKELVTSIKLNKSAVKLGVKKSTTLKATIENTSATNTKVKWTTSNKKIATVNSAGKVTAKKIGTCKIKAKATDGSGASATCKITVVQKVKKLQLNHAYIKIMEGKTAKLKARIKPKNASKKGLAWSSSDTSIAIVDSKGKINALAAGTAEISVETTDGTKRKATCIVQVLEENPVTSMTVSASDVTMVEGTSQSASVVISPVNTTDQITYESDNRAVASVTSKGKITAKKPGYASITVTSTSGTQVCINVNVVGLNKTSITLQQYDSDDLWVEEVSDDVKWSSSDPSIARVENGNVVGRKVGSCTITASVRGVKLNCKVRVVKIK